MKEPLNIFWFRRDLRLDDNVGLYNALKGQNPVLPIFIFDSEILNTLIEDDARVSFIFETIQDMRSILKKEHNSSIAIFNGKPTEIFKELVGQYKITSVYKKRQRSCYFFKE